MTTARCDWAGCTQPAQITRTWHYCDQHNREALHVEISDENDQRKQRINA